MRLLLIRHGQTPHNVTGALDTAFPGAGLTELGQRQAAAVPEALADEDVGAVYATSLVRTQLTGSPLAQERSLDVQVREGLQEIAAAEGKDVVYALTESGLEHQKTFTATVTVDLAGRPGEYRVGYAEAVPGRYTWAVVRVPQPLSATAQRYASARTGSST